MKDAFSTEPEQIPLADQWYIPARHKIPHGWMVYTFDFVLATLQGYVTEPQKISRAWYWVILGKLVHAGMAVAQALFMLLAWVPLLSSLFEIVSRTFTRNAIGFFLRACYWKSKLHYLGQDTIIDQNVEIWGPASVSIGYRCHVDTFVRLAAGERRHRQHGYIKIGNYVHLGPGVHIAGRGGVEIHDFVGIMANAHLYSATGVVERPDDPGQLISMSHMAPHDQQHIIESPILIEEYAFIGMMTRILPGVRVGQGAVVHANCELVRSVPAFANIGGIARGRQIGWRKPRRRSLQLETTERPLVIRTVNRQDDLKTLDEVIEFHFEAFPDGVTTHLGRDFVRRYYMAMIKNPDATLWVAERNGRLCGFMGCSTNRRIFEKAHRSGSTKMLALWRFMTLRLNGVALMRALRKRQRSHNFPDRAELLSIVVAPWMRRSGLGKSFLDIWMKSLCDASLGSYLVFTDNPEGIRFYEKYNGECLFKFQLRNLWSACYRFQVEDMQGQTGAITLESQSIHTPDSDRVPS
jgi:acetyltransferase-like isoleucine patch superfamily enzyme/ribosomal protein S18 acetylase RimI-like enzyme